MLIVIVIVVISCARTRTLTMPFPTDVANYIAQNDHEQRSDEQKQKGNRIHKRASVNINQYQVKTTLGRRQNTPYEGPQGIELFKLEQIQYREIQPRSARNEQENHDRGTGFVREVQTVH